MPKPLLLLSVSIRRAAPSFVGPRPAPRSHGASVPHCWERDYHPHPRVGNDGMLHQRVITSPLASVSGKPTKYTATLPCVVALNLKP